MVGNTLRQFGLEAKDAARVTDVMAVAFGNSALDLERFSGSMANVAPLPGTLASTLRRPPPSSASSPTTASPEPTQAPSSKSPSPTSGPLVWTWTTPSQGHRRGLRLQRKPRPPRKARPDCGAILGNAGKDTGEFATKLSKPQAQPRRPRASSMRPQGALFRMKSALGLRHQLRRVAPPANREIRQHQLPRGPL